MLDPDLIRARERLEASRERLLAHMRGEADPADAEARPAVASGERRAPAAPVDAAGQLSLLAALRQRVEAHPVGAVLLDTGQLWWERHPARAVVACNSSRALGSSRCRSRNSTGSTPAALASSST